MLGFPILYFKGMRLMMFQLSGFYCTAFFCLQSHSRQFREVAGDNRRVDPDEGFTNLAISDFIWEFPKIGGTLFGGPYSKDPTI